MRGLRPQEDALPLAEDRRFSALEKPGQSGTDSARLRLRDGQRQAGSELVASPEDALLPLPRSRVQALRRARRHQVLQERLPHSQREKSEQVSNALFPVVNSKC